MPNILCSRIRYIVPFMFKSNETYDDIIEKITKAKLLNDGDSEEISIERIVVDEDISLDDFLKMLGNGL